MSSKYPAAKPRLRASCDGCFLAKVKCSKARPICTRCLQVGLICRYSPSSRTAPGQGGPSTPNGRSRPSRALMASTLSDESCEDLSRWLSQQWAANEHHHHHPTAPGGTNLPMWHGTQAGLAVASRIGQGQSGATLPGSSHNSSSAVLAPPSWASYQSPSYPIGPSPSYSSVPNSAHGFSTQQPPWVTTFEASSSVSSPSQNNPLPPLQYPHPHPPSTDRFRPQSWSDSSTSVSTSSDLPDWTMAWQNQPQVPFGCEPASSSDQQQSWDADSFINHH